MRLDTNLLNDVYRNDEFFQKLKAAHDKWKNHNRPKKHIVDSQRDIILLKLKVNFTKYPNILINQLLEVNFKSKECFKMFIVMYKFMLTRNNMRFKCKKEYLRKLTKIHRNALNRCLEELEEKRMLFVEKEGGYFYFTLNLCFADWNIPQHEKAIIKENNQREIDWYDDKYIQEEDIL